MPPNWLVYADDLILTLSTVVLKTVFSMFYYEVDVFNQSKNIWMPFFLRTIGNSEWLAKHSRRINELQHKVLPSGPLQCHCLVTMIMFKEVTPVTYPFLPTHHEWSRTVPKRRLAPNPHLLGKKIFHEQDRVAVLMHIYSQPSPGKKIQKAMPYSIVS